MISLSPLVGVPERLVVIEVMSAARAVIVCISTLSVLIVGVALEASVLTLGVIRLLVNVFVLEMDGIATAPKVIAEAVIVEALIVLAVMSVCAPA